MKFHTIPQWVKPQSPDVLALFEVFALLGIEGEWVRVAAEDQRAIMGGAVFGRQEFRTTADGAIEVRRSVCFGTTKEVQEYSPARVKEAIGKGLKLSPGTSGPGYLW